MLSDTIFYAPSAGNPINQAVIMLHGYGADGNDLISMAPMMAEKLTDTVFYAPNAPVAMAQTGGYKWFDIKEQAASTVYERFGYIEQLMGKAKSALQDVFSFVDFIAQKHRLPSDKIVLMGFSQGGLLALMTGLLKTPALRGVIGCSAVPISINANLNLGDIKSKPPVLLTQGEDDDVVPFIGMQISQNTLKNIGCDVTVHTVAGMGHDIDKSSIDAMIDFIQKLK